MVNRGIRRIGPRKRIHHHDLNGVVVVVFVFRRIGWDELFVIAIVVMVMMAMTVAMMMFMGFIALVATGSIVIPKEVEVDVDAVPPLVATRLLMRVQVRC